jgi:hypothetical protein
VAFAWAPLLSLLLVVLQFAFYVVIYVELAGLSKSTAMAAQFD